MEGKSITVLIPCLNEEVAIGKVVRDFRKYLPEARVVVYDNDSTDKTAQVARDAGAEVVCEPQRGKGNVVRSMFEQTDADIYVLVDGDDTYPAEEVQKLIAPVAEGKADMVVGDRLSSSYFSENKRPFHNMGNRLVRSLVNRLFKRRLADIMSGYRVMSRRFVKNFPVISSGFEIETEMTVFALERHFKVREIPVAYRDRPEGSVSKLNTVFDGVKVLKTVMMLFRDYRPFAFFSTLAFVAACVGLGLFVPVLVEYWKTGLVPRFPTLIVACFIILVSILLFFVGLLLDVIKRNNDRTYHMLKLHNPDM